MVGEPKRRGLADLFGIICSVGCAIHCAATPILLIALPSLTAVKWMADPAFHQIVAVVCGAIAVFSIIPGFRRHGDIRVPFLAGSGVVCLLVAAFILPCNCGKTLRESEAAQLTLNRVGLEESSRESEPSSAGISGSNVCDDEDCPYCNHQPHASCFLSEAQLKAYCGNRMASWVMRMQPWVTPFGGLLLIMAHGLNIRHGIRCHRGCAGH
jgi:hypothetical protein